MFLLHCYQPFFFVESPAAPAGMGSLESLNIDSMLRHTFIPDYTVRATTEVLYLKIKRSLYLAAKRATLMEKSKRENQTAEQFNEEIDKVSDKSKLFILYCVGNNK